MQQVFRIPTPFKNPNRITAYIQAYWKMQNNWHSNYDIISAFILYKTSLNQGIPIVIID